MSFALLATTAYALVVKQQNRSQIAGAARVLRLAHSLDTKHPVHLGMVRMAEVVEELSDGKLKLDITPNGTLGSETQCLEMLQHGVLDMAKTSSAPLEGFVPEVAVFGVPYVFRDEAHCWRVLDGPIGKRLLAAGADKGIVGLCYYDAGARSFYTVSKPIVTPSDLEGLKIRVQSSNMAIQMVKALGGAATPLEWGELYTALHASMLDGAENNLPSFYTSRHFEVCRYFSFDEHTRVPDMLLISTITWQTLSDTQRGWLQQASAESVLLQRQLWREETERVAADLEAAGVQFTRPDQALFREKVQPLHESLAGTVVGDLMKEIDQE
ncbi:MAG: TRAP transporter substrate-binding protein [Planctomycetales bacterium]|nr:TRAP transporter substrate-binding protein [Planctomycetales bacterium]